MSADHLEEEVLKLPPVQRARIAERIIASLDGADGVDREWLRQVKRRGHDLEAAAAAATREVDLRATLAQEPRFVSMYVRPRALDDFIERWRREKSSDWPRSENAGDGRPS